MNDIETEQFVFTKLQGLFGNQFEEQTGRFIPQIGGSLIGLFQQKKFAIILDYLKANSLIINL